MNDKAETGEEKIRKINVEIERRKGREKRMTGQGGERERQRGRERKEDVNE